MHLIAWGLLAELTRQQIIEELGLDGFDLGNRLHVLALLLVIALLITIYAAVWGRGTFGAGGGTDCPDTFDGFGDFGGD